jgi:hypothetical protein
MAAVTTNNQPTRHVFGDCVVRFFDISGASGSTLATGIQQILWIGVQQSTSAGVASAITSFSYTGNPSTITFTTGGGAMTNERIMVIGRVG